MVHINGVKYACEACIKGHRSSSCAHTERPLFEIKKKGRPVTQCEHCRKLRKTKQVHVKCSCGGAADSEDKKDSRGKAKRKAPPSAAFPDGLQGVVASTSSSPSPAPQRKSKIEPPCACGSTGECACATPVSKPRASSSSSASSGPATPPPVVSSCCSGKSKPTPVPQSVRSDPYASDGSAQAHAPVQQVLNYARPASPVAHVRDFYAPPLASPTTEFTWPLGSGIGVCSCGASCTCPGCVEHSDPSSALSSAENCPYACSTCIDCNGFGFAPAAASGPALSQGSEWADFPGWPTPALPVTPMTSAASDCCGGSCKCASEAMECQCADSCCGCCFGCACSDSDGAVGDSDSLDDIAPRLGFAVSGERASCCSEEKRGCKTDADADADERRRKRRRVEREGGGSDAVRTVVNVSGANAQNPYRAITQTPTPFSFIPPSAGPTIDWPVAPDFR